MQIERSEREPRRRSLDGAEVDLLVIGGGIVGAGVARDAASRGLSTLLVEQSDFASGTSSRSSRLLHGGLRYLAQGRIGLVWESSREKMRLSRIASHLCQPLPFLFPVWKGSGWSLWSLALGVKVYDLLCGGRNLGKSSRLDADDLRKRLPGLRSEGLIGGTRHFDALTNDARLVLDTMRSAEAHGALLRNYTRFEQARRGDTGWICLLEDRLTGGQCTVRSRSIVNAAGAWAARFPQSGIQLRLTKGVHLVVSQQALPAKEAVILPSGDRILFVIPWGERTILGTTDTDYSGDPATVRTTAEDVAAVLDVVSAAFPRAGLSAKDVISSWAGIRPLIAPRVQKSGAPSDISRSHLIRMSESGWLDVAGGKLTTYRLMAEQTVDTLGRYLGRQLPPPVTATEALPAGRFSGVLPPPIERGVVSECCRQEWAVHLDDMLRRRTSWQDYYGPQESLIEQVADWMSEELGWSEEERSREIDRYVSSIDLPPISPQPTGGEWGEDSRNIDSPAAR